MIMDNAKPTRRNITGVRINTTNVQMALPTTAHPSGKSITRKGAKS